MPWWIWLILAIFFVSMFLIGSVYAFIKLNKGLVVVSESADKISDIYDRFDTLDNKTVDDKPLFTQPIAVAARRYEEAHKRVILRDERKKEIHKLVWQHWSNKSLREEELNSSDSSDSSNLHDLHDLHD